MAQQFSDEGPEAGDAAPGMSLALQSLEPVDGRLTWNYFDELGYVVGGGLRDGEDPYVRNRFNQKASDSLPSNRNIPDTRNKMYVALLNSQLVD